ncbi:MAG TPA: hypothetical protein VMV07_26270 [Streptosporangiaceae bacterium]|nr:hypothetical protein [Streptosporangiaceae bacterium]
MAEWRTVEVFHGEVSFADDAQRQVLSALPAVRAALDAVPAPVNGLLARRGRGGGAASPPRPSAGAGAVDLPEPHGDTVVDLAGIAPAYAAQPGSPAQLNRTA